MANTDVPFLLNGILFFAAYFRKKSMLPKQQRSVYESLIIFGNQGFIGFAIIYMLLEERGIMYVTLFNICYLFCIWSYGIYLFTKRERAIRWKPLLLNPGILSTSIGTVMLFLPYSWPNALSETLETVGKMTIPLSMILIGSLLSEISWNHFLTYCRNKYIWFAASLRLILLPITLLVFLFFNVPFYLLFIAVLTSATPSASTTSLYAEKFGADATFASFGVFVTTILCLVTIPFLYAFLHWIQVTFY